MSATDGQHTEHMRRNIALVTENIVHTNNCIADAQDKALRARMKAKNDRRLAALEQMQRTVDS